MKEGKFQVLEKQWELASNEQESEVKSQRKALRSSELGEDPALWTCGVLKAEGGQL